MNRLKYFMQCYFCQTFGFEDLDERINDFKGEVEIIQKELIKEIEIIIENKDYHHLSKFMKKHCDIEFDNLCELEKFIFYLYDRLTNRRTAVKATDFISD